MNSEPFVVLVEKQPFFARFKSGNFLNSLTGAISMSATGDVKTSVKGALGIVKYETNPGHRAYELIFNALGIAAVRLLKKEHREIIKGNHLNVKLNIDKEIDALELEVTLTFFADPKNFELIKAIRPVYKNWLIFLGLSEDIAQQLQRKLSHQFLLELTKEWDERPAYYQLILDQFNTPFYEAWKKEYYTLKYQDELRELIHEPAMGDELLPLSTIYVKPHFSLHEDCWNHPNKTHYERAYRDDGFLSEIKFKENLHNYIEQKVIYRKTPLEIAAEKYNFIFVLGQPGQGKSSFCLYTLNQLLEHKDFEQNLYFIRLKDLQHKDELIQHPFNVIEDYLKDKHNLEFITKDTVLILDGLDELFMVNGLSNADLEKFYKNLEEKLKKSDNLSIILTSRYNYLNLSVVNKKKTTILKLDGLSFKQQKKWLSIYREIHTNCKLTQEKLKEIYENERLTHIKELIQQPILLHIVANSNADLSSLDTRSTIYKKLFDALLQRSWANEQLEKYHSLEEEEYAQEFREWLQHIAFSIYSSNFEYIQRKDLEALDSTKNIQGIINTSANLKDALKDLLVAFYFKNVRKYEIDEIEEDNKNKKYALEFLHKSLQEYLAAEYIWRTIKDKCLAPHDKKWKFDISDFKQALSLFFGLFSNKGLNDSIRTLLVEMIEQDPFTGKKKLLRERLKQLFSDCLKYQFLDTTMITKHVDLDTPPLIKAFNTFRGYWLILSHLDATQNNNLIQGNELEIFCYLTTKSEGRHINLSHTILKRADLKQANLSYANLSYANLLHADLKQANLEYTNFKKSNLNWIDLRWADLRGAYLVEASLNNANLFQANFAGANLKETQLTRSSLMQVNLTGANLKEADLKEADLSHADLSHADLNHANLNHANLRLANLRQANLSYSNLNFIGLGYTNLSYVNLTQAKVSNINFIDQLKKWKCKGATAIKMKYYVDTKKNYYKWDTNKETPYYLIKEK